MSVLYVYVFILGPLQFPVHVICCSYVCSMYFLLSVLCCLLVVLKSELWSGEFGPPSDMVPRVPHHIDTSRGTISLPYHHVRHLHHRGLVLPPGYHITAQNICTMWDLVPYPGDMYGTLRVLYHPHGLALVSQGIWYPRIHNYCTCGQRRHDVL